MGNCLQPSEAEIHKAKLAKLQKRASYKEELSGVYPYPGNPYQRQPMPGYFSPPGPQPSYVAVDPRTGQQFLVQGIPGPMPIPHMFAYDPDHMAKMSRRQSRLSANLVQETQRSKKYSQGDQTDASDVHVHASDIKENRTLEVHQNGGVGIFTDSGVMDLEAETVPVIVDFLVPIVPDPPKDIKQEAPISTVEYESAKDKPESPLPVRRHSPPPPMEEDFIFPPKIVYTTEEENHTLDMLKSTLSQTSSTSLPSDPVDVVITYSVLGEYELDIIRRLARQLELVGLSVWAERLGDSSKARKSDKTAEAILGTKVLIVMLSEGSCEQRFLRDHVAIATMKNVSIFPVTSEPPKDVKNAMPLELKIHLAPYVWTELLAGNEESFLFQLRSLARSVQDDIEEQNDSKPNAKVLKGNLLRQMSTRSAGMAENSQSFWDVHFGHRDSVKWERLENAINDAYKSSIQSVIPGNMHTLLFQSIKNRTSKDDTDIYRSDFFSMCHSVDGQEIDVWETLLQVAGMIQAVRDAYEVKSTVRHLAIEYTELFSSPDVLSALRDVLSDPDPNLRAAAVVALSRCMAPSDSLSLERVVKALEDVDQLVREVGCLALGHLKAESAVKKLTDVWRNDDIPQVREAAKVSLDQIGGQEVVDTLRDDAD